jgi:hypothetical protein
LIKPRKVSLILILQDGPPVIIQKPIAFNNLFLPYHEYIVIIFPSLGSSAISGTFGQVYKKRMPQSNIRNVVFIDKYYNKYSINSEKDGSPES